jgi:DNA-binding transcriptional LysR family regulator
MDLRQFRYFVAVAEELNFTRAAARLHIGQPPLSIQIKAVEEELGIKLFERNRHRVELTRAGETLLEGAYKLLSLADSTILAAQRVAKGELGVIRIGFSTDVPLLPAFRLAVHEHRTGTPNVRLDLLSATASSQIEGLTVDKFDVGFIRPSIFRRLPREINTVPVLLDRLSLVVNADHRLARGVRPVSIEDLKDEPFVFFPPNVGTYDHVIALCSRAGFMPKIVQVSRDGASIISLVETGLGVTILPTLFASRSSPGAVFRPLVGDDAASNILMSWRTDEVAPHILGFVALVKAILEKQAVELAA